MSALGRPGRILAVDDQPANLTLVRRILVPAGFELREARSGAEALAEAREGLPDLILLDMHLPDMHGLEVLRRLRESAWGAGMRVVAMSALANPDDEALWIEAGCAGTISKPIDVKTFAQTVAAWLSETPPPSALPTDGEHRDRLGGILLDAGLVTQAQLARGLAAQRESSRRLGQILVDQGAVSEDDIAWALSSQLGYPYIFLTPDIIDDGAARELPDEFLRERRVLPILRFGEEMTLAMADPTDQRTVDDVAGRTHLQVKRALALGSNIEAMLDRLFAGRSSVPEAGLAAEAQYLQFHLVQALAQDASEIHFDPAGEGQARVRYRLQGDMIDRAGQPADLHADVVRYLRRITGAGDEAAAAGAGTVMVGEAEIYFTAAFLSTMAGPAATLSLYPRRAEVPSLAPLGVSERTTATLRGVLEAARGAVVVGCRDPLLRSTLLHALMPAVPRGKIWALETLPVYRRPTLNQTVLRPGAEAAAAVRAAAAGADLVAIDDVSHRETLAAALEAGAWRLLLAAHPQDDPAGLLSLIVETVGGARTASALGAILAARPVRLLCAACKEAVGGGGRVGLEEAAPLQTGAGGRQAFLPKGCELCAFTGFRGRRLLTAAWVADDASRLALRTGRYDPLYERLTQEAAASFREQGLALVEDGLTSPAELARTVGGASWT